MRNLELFFQLQIHESGLLIADTGVKPGHSFLKQFSQLIYNTSPFGVSRFAPASVTNTAGTAISTTGGMSLRTDASTSVSTYGIMVGTGTTAESINDAALVTQIATGTSAGQLQYGSMTYGAPSTTATTTTFRFTRVFTNGSGGTVTVQEIGLASRDSANTKGFLWLRDLTGAVAVTNGQQLTVNYDFTTTV